MFHVRSLHAWTCAIAAMATLLPIAPVLAAEPSKTGLESLKAQVQALQDRLEIQQLLVEYGHLLDTHDLVGYSRLFARNGEWIGGFGRARGPREVLAMMQKYIGTAPYDPRNVKGFHLLTNMVIHVDGDHATAWSRIVYMVRNKDDKPVPAMGGHYDDVLVREDGHWRFQKRVVMMEIPYQDPREIKGEPPPAPLTVQ